MVKKLNTPNFKISERRYRGGGKILAIGLSSNFQIKYNQQKQKRVGGMSTNSDTSVKQKKNL